MAVLDTASLHVGLVFLLHTWGVWAMVEVNMEDRVEVFKGSTAEITCMFISDEGIGGMVIQWAYVTPSGEKKEIYYQDATIKRVLRDTTFTDRINVSGPANGAKGGVLLTINSVQLKDQLEFICIIKDLTGVVAEGRTQLKVFETPQRPTIDGVSTGFSVNEDSLSKIGVCEVKNGFPKPKITWYRNNMPLRNSHDVNMEHSSTVESSGLISARCELNKKVIKEDKDAEFYCEVSYFVPGAVRMTETNRINITVYYPSTAVRVWVESPKSKIKEGDSIEIHCQGNGNSPFFPLSISRKDVEFSMENNSVVLDSVTRLNSGVYKCTLIDIDTAEEISGNTTVFVNYLDPAVVEPTDTFVVTQGEELKATCNALSSLKTNTAWFKNGKEISQGHTLILKDATFDNAGTYTCVVTVPEIEGMETSATLGVNVEGPPEIFKPDNTEIEESFENTVELSCVVKGFPAPSITWTTADGKVLKEASQTETDEGVEGLVEVKVTSDITVLCSASNKHGRDTLTFNIKATKHTSTPATTTTTTSTTNTTTTTVSSATVKAETPERIKKGGSGVIIAVIIICILLLAILGSVLYFLYKTGRICGRSGKQDLTKEKSNKDNIVVEMKSDNTEEAILLGVNGEKQPSSDQGGEYLDVQK